MMDFEKVFESVVRRVVQEENAKNRVEIERSLNSIRDELARLNPPDAKAEQEVFTLEDVSEFSGLKPETLRKRYVADGTIKCFKDKDSHRWKLTRDEFMRHKTYFEKYHSLAGRA